MAGSLSVKNLTRTRVRVSFFEIAHKRAAPHFEVSLLLATPAIAQQLNKQLRKKTYVPNVLSWLVSENSGEIVLCPEEIRKQAKTFGMSYTECMIFMFIHACLHLKGHLHGDTMERAERQLHTAVMKSITHEKTHSHRN